MQNKSRFIFISALFYTEGQYGEVVVLLSAVAELVGVDLEGLYHVAHTLRSLRRHLLDNTLLAILFLLAVQHYVPGTVCNQLRHLYTHGDGRHLFA